MILIRVIVVASCSRDGSANLQSLFRALVADVDGDRIRIGLSLRRRRRNHTMAFIALIVGFPVGPLPRLSLQTVWCVIWIVRFWRSWRLSFRSFLLIQSIGPRVES